MKTSMPVFPLEGKEEVCLIYTEKSSLIKSISQRTLLLQAHLHSYPSRQYIYSLS